MKRRPPKPELGQAGASGEELGEQERQAEVQEGHGSHHQGVGSSLENRGNAISVPEYQAKDHLPALAEVAKLKFPRHLSWGRGVSSFFFFDCKTDLFSQPKPHLSSALSSQEQLFLPPPSTPLPPACHVAQAKGAWP